MPIGACTSQPPKQGWAFIWSSNSSLAVHVLVGANTRRSDYSEHAACIFVSKYHVGIYRFTSLVPRLLHSVFFHHCEKSWSGEAWVQGYMFACSHCIWWGHSVVVTVQVLPKHTHNLYLWDDTAWILLWLKGTQKSSSLMYCSLLLCCSRLCLQWPYVEANCTSKCILHVLAWSGKPSWQAG